MNFFSDFLDENRDEEKNENPIKTKKCSSFDVIQSPMPLNIIEITDLRLHDYKVR